MRYKDIHRELRGVWEIVVEEQDDGAHWMVQNVRTDEVWAEGNANSVVAGIVAARRSM